MVRNALAAAAIAVMTGTVMGADYFFPTAYPQGVDLDTVKQIVTFIWDDNAYSGLDQTNYETEPGQDFKEHSWVGGKKPWSATADASLNPMGLNSGDFGMSWAITELAGRDMPVPEWKADVIYKKGMQCAYEGSVWEANYEGTAGSIPKESEWSGGQWKKVGPIPNSITKTNPDGSPLSFTFNVISGLFVPIYGPEDGMRESKFGSWNVNDKDVEEFPHLKAYYNNGKKVAVCWGREQPVKADANAEGNIMGEAYGKINEVFVTTRDFGHEIGNHTIDHLETNSALPNDERGFGRWGGEGFAAERVYEVSWGDTTFTVDEAVEFGRREGISWHSMGWKPYAGRMLSKTAWKGLIELGEEDLEIALGVSRGTELGDVKAFRAPRLEVNGAMHYALKELGYTYDCGQEEGYEYNIDGSNFYWPYTSDNGSPNVTWQRSIGEHVSIDSMPAGLWQIPVNAMIVPEEIREDVWKNHAIIARAEYEEGKGHNPTAEDSTHWVNNSGKITGFDFNMFILWGMTEENALKTLKYNLDERMKGGKAPMQVGSHTDYFTPIYDIATLRDSHNISTYGLCVTNEWNDWKARKRVFSDFVDYGLSKGAYFWSGDRVIEYTRKIAAAAKVGEKKNFNAEWQFVKNENLNSSANLETFSGSIDAEITVAAEDKTLGADGVPYASFSTSFNKGELTGIDHLSLQYHTNTPLAVRLLMADNKPSYEVWLNNLNVDVKSGNIPLSAFHYNQYETEGQPKGLPKTSDIVGIEIQPITNVTKISDVKFKITDFAVYSGETSTSASAVAAAKKGVALKSFTKQGMKLDIPVAGLYSVEIVTLDGRIVRSLKGNSFYAGLNSVSFDALGSGFYLLNIRGANFQKTLKAAVM